MLEAILKKVSLFEWKTKRTILDELSSEFDISERKFRKLIEQNNRLFAEGKVDFYIAHSFRGYKLTFNWDEIKKSVVDNRKRAITMLQDCRNVEMAFQRRNQIKMEEIYENN